MRAIDAVVGLRNVRLELPETVMPDPVLVLPGIDIRAADRHELVTPIGPAMDRRDVRILREHVSVFDLVEGRDAGLIDSGLRRARDSDIAAEDDLLATGVQKHRAVVSAELYVELCA